MDIVWNLAAPLSVDTAKDPDIAYEVVVKGMKNLLQCCEDNNVRQVCFSDSIGSFGKSSPRIDATASWLTENPGQDPGSEYGSQKRSCRNLMRQFSSIDTRW